MQYDVLARMAQNGDEKAKDVLSRFWIWFFAHHNGKSINPAEHTKSSAFEKFCNYLQEQAPGQKFSSSHLTYCPS